MKNKNNNSLRFLEDSQSQINKSQMLFDASTNKYYEKKVYNNKENIIKITKHFFQKKNAKD